MASPEEFEAHRPRLFGLAYRMLGSAADAEDAVQDAFLRWNGADRGTIASPSAWLTKVAINLCLNQLTSARARRESYIGPWLPEPVPSDALGPLESAEQRESVSLAVLVLLERLAPVEWAVFVARGVRLQPSGDRGHRRGLGDQLPAASPACSPARRRVAATFPA